MSVGGPAGRRMIHYMHVSCRATAPIMPTGPAGVPVGGCHIASPGARRSRQSVTRFPVRARGRVAGRSARRP